MAQYFPMDDMHLNIARGLVKGTSFNHKFGACPSMSTNPGVGSIWDVADTYYPWSAYNPGAAIVNIERNNIADEGKEVVVQGLDGNYNFAEDRITINGADTLGTVQFIRVNRAYIEDGVTNVGHVDIEYGAAGGTTIARITAGMGQTLMAVYTIPAGYTGYLCQGTMTIQEGADCTGNMYVKYGGTTTFRVGHTFELTGGGQYFYPFAVPIPIPEKSDIDVRARVRSNNARITAAFDVILIKDHLGSTQHN